MRALLPSDTRLPQARLETIHERGMQLTLTNGMTTQRSRLGHVQDRRHPHLRVRVAEDDDRLELLECRRAGRPAARRPVPRGVQPSGKR